jgi:hypothetical protein
MHTTPASLRLRQSPPAASTPAPGPHTSRVKQDAYATRDSGHQLIQITLAPFQLQVRRFSSLSSWSVSFNLAVPEHRMSLSTLVLFADVAQRQTRYACNPWLIQAEPEPPGRLPPAPGSHIRRADPLPGALCVSSGGGVLSSARADSRTSPFCLAAS